MLSYFMSPEYTISDKLVQVMYIPVSYTHLDVYKRQHLSDRPCIWQTRLLKKRCRLT